LPTSDNDYSPLGGRTTSCEIAPGTKLLRRPELLVALRNHEPVPVLNVEVFPSESCNARCRGCLAPLHRNVNMTRELVGPVTHTLNSWGTEAVVLTGGGEPTCCPDFEYIVDILSANFKVGLYTNGISPRFVKVADRFTWVYVSLDAADEDSWQAYKGVHKRCFQQVLENIHAARYLTNVGVGFLIGKDNYLHPRVMAAVADEVGADYIHFRPRWPSEIEGDRQDYSRVGLEMAQALHPKVCVAWDKFERAWHWNRPYGKCWYSMVGRCIGADGGIFACPSAWPKRRLGHVSEPFVLAEPLPVTDECRKMCRGDAICRLVDYVMSDGGEDKDFV